MNIPADICVLVADHGVGDHYIVAGFAGAIGRQYGLRVWLAGKRNLSFLAALYPAAEKYLEWPDNLAPSSVGGKEIRGGDFFHAHFPGLELMRAVGYNGFHFLDAYRCRFGLPAATRLTAARWPAPVAVAEAAEKLRAQGLDPRRTVLLGIDARSTPTDGVTPEFWLGLARRLQAAGLTPVVNATPSTQVPAGLARVAAPLHELRALAMAMAGVCSVRSGFSDLLCDLPCPQAVVYPEVRYWAGPLLAGTTFARYDLAAPPREMTVTPARAESCAAELAAYFASKAASSRAA